MVASVFDDSLYITTAHQFGDHVGLTLMLSQVKHGDDMRVGAETAHCLSFPGDPGAGDLVQTLGLDQGEGHLPVQQGVLSQVDPLLAALSQEPLDLIAAFGEGRRLFKRLSRRSR